MAEEKKEENIPCDVVVKELREKLSINMEARRKIDELSSELVGRDYFEYTRVFGLGPWSVGDIIVGIYREIERGNVRAENGKLCRFGNCIDQIELFTNIYNYYSTSFDINEIFPLIINCKL
jgi:hypothetical protein